VNPLPVVTFGPVPDPCINEGGFLLTQGSPAGGVYSGTGVMGGAFDPGVGIGDYTITYIYTDADGCTDSTTQNISVIGCLGTEETEEVSVNIYPNPTQAQVSLELTGDVKVDHIELIDEYGHLLALDMVAATQVSMYLYTFDLSALPNGIYHFRIHTGEHVLVKRIIKNGL
jgi:hypothetical protein